MTRTVVEVHQRVGAQEVAHTARAERLAVRRERRGPELDPAVVVEVDALRHLRPDQVLTVGSDLADFDVFRGPDLAPRGVVTGGRPEPRPRKGGSIEHRVACRGVQRWTARLRPGDPPYAPVEAYPDDVVPQHHLARHEVLTQHGTAHVVVRAQHPRCEARQHLEGEAAGPAEQADDRIADLTAGVRGHGDRGVPLPGDRLEERAPEAIAAARKRVTDHREDLSVLSRDDRPEPIQLRTAHEHEVAVLPAVSARYGGKARLLP